MSQGGYHLDLTLGRDSDWRLLLASEWLSLLWMCCLAVCDRSTVSHLMKGCPMALSSSSLQITEAQSQHLSMLRDGGCADYTASCFARVMRTLLVRNFAAQGEETHILILPCQRYVIIEQSSRFAVNVLRSFMPADIIVT